MSAFELPAEHLAALAHVGAVLQVDRRMSLDAFPDSTVATATQHAVFHLLWDQHAAPLRSRAVATGAAAKVPPMPAVRVPLQTDAHLVQVLQWIRCYEYQSSSDESWRRSAARGYCRALERRVVDELIDRHRPSWVYEPASTNRHDP